MFFGLFFGLFVGIGEIFDLDSEKISETIRRVRLTQMKRVKLRVKEFSAVYYIGARTWTTSDKGRASRVNSRC